MICAAAWIRAAQWLVDLWTGPLSPVHHVGHHGMATLECVFLTTVTLSDLQPESHMESASSGRRSPGRRHVVRAVT